GYCKAQRIILGVRSQSIQPSQPRSVNPRAASPGISRTLREKSRDVRLFEDLKLGSLLIDESVLFRRNGVLCHVQRRDGLLGRQLTKLRRRQGDLLRRHTDKLR